MAKLQIKLVRSVIGTTPNQKECWSVRIKKKRTSCCKRRQCSNKRYDK